MLKGEGGLRAGMGVVHRIAVRGGGYGQLMEGGLSAGM